MIRLILLIFLFLAAWLTVLHAPQYHLWILSILVTEFCWVFIIATILALILGYGDQRYHHFATVIGIIALLLYCTPMIRGYGVAAKLNPEFEAAFGKGSASLKSEPGKKPLRFFRMITGISAKQIVPAVYTYDETNNLKLDYYPSQVAGNKGCVIVVHGGSWSSGNSTELPELNSYLANKGYNVAAINYRLAPKYQYQAPVQDVHSAIRYLCRHADSLHIDTNSFVLLGRSAGGQIALLAAYTLHDPGVKGVISYYAPADMVWGYSIPSNRWIMDSRKVMEDYLGGSYGQVPGNYAASSPILHVDKTSVPTLLIHGQNDVLVAYEHSRRLNIKLQENGIKHYLLTLPWAVHGCDYTLNGPSGQLATYTVERFLNQVIR
ncbi:alpha/beta hydrolase [Mucilaginibacter sp. PPCGB 2223]|uniref:alpha/beta hydrolase n=1 Tax=Mucilaginibacter sp. PPCGB 2223 TaxID=1886027 RepID=UPI000825573F|nr:alpha/beta hydrolase [Mucilaginibacter sp. PPCGB 2223]OCX54170.1 alpha/beta hydrolase [Mucilaginibacter sp. PPCGB 2223]